jgi:hypothetical protein
MPIVKLEVVELGRVAYRRQDRHHRRSWLARWEITR